MHKKREREGERKRERERERERERGACWFAGVDSSCNEALKRNRRPVATYKTQQRNF
jgi:hypothetical protein